MSGESGERNMSKWVYIQHETTERNITAGEGARVILDEVDSLALGNGSNHRTSKNFISSARIHFLSSPQSISM